MQSAGQKQVGAGLCKAAALPLNLWTQRPCRSCMQRHRRSTSYAHAAAVPAQNIANLHVMQRLARSNTTNMQSCSGCAALKRQQFAKTCCSKAEGRRQRLRRSKTQQICQNSCCSKAAGPQTNHKKCAARRKKQSGNTNKPPRTTYKFSLS